MRVCLMIEGLDLTEPACFGAFFRIFAGGAIVDFAVGKPARSPRPTGDRIPLPPPGSA